MTDVTIDPPALEVLLLTVTPNDGPIDEGGVVDDVLAGAKLLFVYNADSGVMNALKDYAHKSVSPATYQCNLCALTFGSMGMKNSWAEYIKDLGVPVEFLHRDELRERYGVEDVYLPAVLLRDDAGIRVWIPASEITPLWTLDELKGLVSIRLRELQEERSSS